MRSGIHGSRHVCSGQEDIVGCGRRPLKKEKLIKSHGKEKHIPRFGVKCAECDLVSCRLSCVSSGEKSWFSTTSAEDGFVNE